MDETPTEEALNTRRRRLLFRANHRGTRENDILVGGYVAARIGAFTATEMAALEEILELPDPLLADWLTGRAPIPAEPDDSILRAPQVRPMLRAMREARGA